MYANVFVSGVLGQKVDDFYRYIHVKREVPNKDGFVTDKFLICHFSKSVNNLLFKTKNKQNVTITGRLEQSDSGKVIIVAEKIYLLNYDSNLVDVSEE